MTGAYSSAAGYWRRYLSRSSVGVDRATSLPADDDRAPLAVVLLGELAGVAGVVAQLVGPDDLDVVDVDDQQGEQHQELMATLRSGAFTGCTTSVGASPSRWRRGRGAASPAGGRRR